VLQHDQYLLAIDLRAKAPEPTGTVDHIEPGEVPIKDRGQPVTLTVEVSELDRVLWVTLRMYLYRIDGSAITHNFLGLFLLG